MSDLKKDFLEMSANSTIQGTIPCSSAAPAIATDPRTALFIALTNTNFDSISYAIYNQMTGHVVSQGSLSKGNSKSVIIPASDNPNVIRIQNQSSCDSSGITPTLSYAVGTQS